MALQNRVNPFGQLIATPERGAWTGNRGVLHNGQQKIVKKHAVKYWIVEYKGFRRNVMSPNRWTELFFLDEATAFAAGHRPCGFCRYADFKRFKNLWLAANGTRHGLTETAKIDRIDAVIQQERLDENGSKKVFQATLATLPDGTFVSLDKMGKAYLWFQQRLCEWSLAVTRMLPNLTKIKSWRF